MEITSEMITQNANDAADRGAALMDIVIPGWAEGLTGLADPVGDREQAEADLDLFLPATVGKLENLTPADYPVGTVFFDEVGNLLAMLGISSPSPVPEAEAALDLGYYGLTPNPMTMGLGVSSSTPLTEEQQTATGYCSQKAATALAAAWTRLIQARNTVSAAA